MGIVDSENGKAFCIPGDSLWKSARVVKKYLNANPAVWNVKGSELVDVALNQEWPCPKHK